MSAWGDLPEMGGELAHLDRLFETVSVESIKGTKP
tara:strand:+ start:341 stop:445 length:105 start_codon:yes stop_codon:yes gene_type:complete